jgi:pimeloyl-ACP methyl ester carboxylesterase
VRRTMLMLLVLPALLWAGFCALIYFQQKQLVYYPGPTRVPAHTTDFELARDGLVLRGWLANAGRDDVLIYFGGNAEAVQHMREPLATWLPDHTSVLLAYRGYGASDGSPQESLLFSDALALYDDLRRRQPDARISVMGRSLGSGVAAYLASQRPVERLVLVTPFDSMVAVAGTHYPWLPTRLLVTERFESARWLAGFRQPVLIIRAGRDQVVPPANTDRLIAALPVPPQVLDLPAADHNSVMASPAEAEALRAFLQPGQP